MVIAKKASAGTMQSSDLTVEVAPSDRLEIVVESTVKKQYGDAIRARIEAVLARHGVTAGLVRVADRGALDYAIDARVETALRRAAEG